MPFQRGTSLAPIILQTAQVMLQANAQRQQAEHQQEQMKAQQSLWAEKFRMQEEVISLKEDALALRVETEKRLKSASDRGMDLKERGLDLKETLGFQSLGLREKRLDLDTVLGKRRLDIAENKAKAAGTGGAVGKLKERKAKFQMIEEDAATRSNAPPQFQAYTDTQKLLAYKNQRQAAIDKFGQYGMGKDPQADAARQELDAINVELMQRAKFKRDHLDAMGIDSSLDTTQNYLPSLVQDPDAEPSAVGPQPQAPAGTTPVDTINLDNVAVSQKAVGSALGLDAAFDSATALKSIQDRHRQFKASGNTDAARNFRIQMYNAIPVDPTETDKEKLQKERMAKFKQLNLQ